MTGSTLEQEKMLKAKNWLSCRFLNSSRYMTIQELAGLMTSRAAPHSSSNLMCVCCCLSALSQWVIWSPGNSIWPYALWTNSEEDKLPRTIWSDEELLKLLLSGEGGESQADSEDKRRDERKLLGSGDSCAWWVWKKASFSWQKACKQLWAETAGLIKDHSCPLVVSPCKNLGQTTTRWHAVLCCAGRNVQHFMIL